MISVRYIPNWRELDFVCVRCGSFKDVKYEVSFDNKTEIWCENCVKTERNLVGKLDEFVKIVEPIYRQDPYRLKLAIQYHIWELFNRQSKLLGDGSDGLDDLGFQKELVDLYLLIQMWIEFNDKRDLVLARQKRFVEHISENMKK